MHRIAGTIIRIIITWEARLVLRKYKPRIVAVTGSVGKTSTKDIIFAALENSVYIRKNNKSFNSEYGVPLTILGCDNGWYNPLKWTANIWEGLKLILLPNHYPKWLVLEVSADKPGDIKSLARWVKPDIAVITPVPADIPAHIEFFKTPEDVLREKKELIKALKKNGTLILNGDDKNTYAFAKEFSQYHVLTYGIEPHNDVVGSNISIHYAQPGVPSGMTFSVSEGGTPLVMQLDGRIGQQHVYPTLAAFAVGSVVKIAAHTIARGITRGACTRGRMCLLEGYNDTTIIDDSYNSSPVALRAALATLKKVETQGKKIAVLGDMRELGRYTQEAHKKAGIQVYGIADVLITVGEHAKDIAQSARDAGFDPECIQEFEIGEAQQAGRTVRAMLERGDVVLVKGSQNTIRLEQAVKEMMLEPNRAKDLLVRQEEQWLAV